MHSFEDFHDSVLLNRARSGDLAALELLLRRHQRVLYTVAVAMLGDADRAREATHMALLLVCGQTPIIDGTHGFLISAHRLLIEECLTLLTREAPRPDGVRDALLRLSPELRAAIVLRHFARLSCDEMAAALDLPLERTRARLRAARQQLEHILDGRADAPRAVAPRLLGQFLRMLTPVDPPAELVPDVLWLIALLGSENIWLSEVVVERG